MTTSWIDEMHASIAQWLRTKHNLDAVKVTDLYESAMSGGFSGCETCGYDNDIIEVEISYIDSSGKSCVWDYCGSLAELITSIT